MGELAPPKRDLREDIPVCDISIGMAGAVYLIFKSFCACKPKLNTSLLLSRTADRFCQASRCWIIITYSIKPKSASTLVHRKPIKRIHSRGRCFTYSVSLTRKLSICSVDTSTPNFRYIKIFGFSDRFKLTILNPEREPFEKVAISRVVPSLTVVEYRLTFSTIQPFFGPLESISCVAADTSILSPMSYGLLAKINSIPS